eukprot:CAMPEP_0185393666 /NCGR_PEP_ID=MMETSP1364-20130426/79146_1 /TAXON_ID=38817 /ORGANISM="Gephyrocapsa oceanica, Strain RCC1303" /LENGTH=59 /DNA_ID=CAMNT_0027995769 /DNA_START=11 /DNA_END=187 /DNA_ORIENTATION=+
MTTASNGPCVRIARRMPGFFRPQTSAASSSIAARISVLVHPEWPMASTASTPRRARRAG